MVDFSFPLSELEFYLLILVRVSCFVFAAPFFSMNNVPGRVRVIISAFISFIVYGVLAQHDYPMYDSVLTYGILVLKEAIAGLVIGFGANLCTMAVTFAGHLVDMETGMSMASQLDPMTKQTSTITGFMYQYGFYLIMIISGMYQYLIRAIVDTFTLIPVGKVEIIVHDIYNTMLEFMGDYIVIGFRIALPVFCTILITNGLLGVMAKVSPQMNMFAVGIQIKLLIGFGVLFFTIGMLPKASDFIYERIKIMIVSFVKALGGA